MRIRDIAIAVFAVLAMSVDAFAQDVRDAEDCRAPDVGFGSRFTAQLVREVHTPNQPSATRWSCPALLGIEAIPYAFYDPSADSSQLVVGYSGLQSIRQTFIDSSSFQSAIPSQGDGCMVEWVQDVRSNSPLTRPRQSDLATPGLSTHHRTVRVIQRHDPAFLGLGQFVFVISDENRFNGVYQSCQYSSVGEVRP